MSDDTKGLSEAARLRAVILDPSSLSGSRCPERPLGRVERLRGGEFVGWDARRDAVMLLEPLLAHALPDPVFRAVGRAIDNPTVRRLQRVEAALGGQLPHDAQHAAREVAELLRYHRAALGCPLASAQCAADSLDSATLHADGADPAPAFLAFRAACLWASDAQADATDVPHVGGPMYARLAAFDQRAHVWLKAFTVMARAEAMIAAEDDILRGGAGQATDQIGDLDWDFSALGDKPTADEAVAILEKAAEAKAAPVAPGLVVIPSLKHLPQPLASTRERGDSPRALGEPWAEKAMPLTPAADPRQFAERLRARFPWAGEAIDVYAQDLVGAPYAALRPRTLVGPPGCGKTEFARAVLEAAGLDVTVYAAAGQMDGGSFAGTSRQWGSWRPSVPAQGCLRHGKASHGITVDEVEKAGTSRRWGRLDETLLPFLERGSTAKAIHDPAFEAALDLSAVSYVLTANSLQGLVQPLLDRAPPLAWPAPRGEDMPVVAAAILEDLRRDRGLDAVWCPDLDPEELDALTAWRGGSLRPLRRMVETVVAARDVLARRMPN